MTPLFRKDDRAGAAWSIGSWHEFDDDDTWLRFADHVSAVSWLRGVEPDGLRGILHDGDGSAPLARWSDDEVVRALAGQLVEGRLRVWPWQPEEGPDEARLGTRLGNRPEDAIVRRLQRTARVFRFEGSRLRIATARQWMALRDFGDSRYEAMDQASALAAMRRIAQWLELVPDERRAIEQALPWVPDTRQAQLHQGIVLLRIVARISARDTVQTVQAATPSQLAGRKKDEELHWIEIELIDDTDQPVPDEAYTVELPDGSVRSGRLDKDGRALIDGIRVGGQCQVCFPEIDTREWKAA